MTAALAIAGEVGVRAACEALDVSRATVYRRLRPREVAPRGPSHRALSAAERVELVRVLNDARFADASPAQVHAALLDEGTHLASVSTMYRVLHASQAVRERRAVRRHPEYAAPELVATGPNQVWSWDITKVRGPQKRDWLHLYVIFDIFSRKVVGWMLATTETASLAQHFIAETLAKEGIVPGTLTLHADRGTSMRSKTVAELLDDLGVGTISQPPAGQQRQPVLGGPVQDDEVLPVLSRQLRVHRRGARVLRALLPLVQRGASPQRHRDADACHRARRPCARGPRPAPGRPGCRLRRPPRAVRERIPQGRRPSRGGLDQPPDCPDRPPPSRSHGVESEFVSHICLILVDTFRRDCVVGTYRRRVGIHDLSTVPNVAAPDVARPTESGGSATSTHTLPRL